MADNYIVWIEENDVITVVVKKSELAGKRHFNKLTRRYEAFGGWPQVYGWCLASKAPYRVRACIPTEA